MKIVEIRENRRKYMDLLLLADEQKEMIEKYINIGKMYILYDD